MKKKQINRCYNCKYAGDTRRAYYTTHLHFLSFGGVVGLE